MLVDSYSSCLEDQTHVLKQRCAEFDIFEPEIENIPDQQENVIFQQQHRHDELTRLCLGRKGGRNGLDLGQFGVL